MRYTNERTVGVQFNAFHFVAVPRADVPAPVGGVLWYGADDQSFAARFPVYSSATAIPPTWKETADQNRTVFKMRSSHWAFSMVAHLAYARWSAVAPVVRARIVAAERRFAAELAAMDAEALALLDSHGAAAAVGGGARLRRLGDLDARHALRERLGCKPFGWFLRAVFPDAEPLPGEPPPRVDERQQRLQRLAELAVASVTAPAPQQPGDGLARRRQV